MGKGLEPQGNWGDSYACSFLCRGVRAPEAQRCCAFGIGVDYAVLQKHYAGSEHQGRYSPPRFTGSTQEVITGNPNKRHISTSYVERQNLTMRMSMRRFTRLTNGFSKKLENHIAANALYFLYYNFARIHRSLRVTPAMAAGIADHAWSIEEIVELLDTRGAVEAA